MHTDKRPAEELHISGSGSDTPVVPPQRTTFEHVRSALKRPIPQFTGELTFRSLCESARVEPTSDIEGLIERETGAVTTMNTIELLGFGPEAFAEIENQIDGAQQSIAINIFSWASDSTGMRLAQKIAEVKKKNPSLKIKIRIDTHWPQAPAFRPGIRPARKGCDCTPGGRY